MSIITGPITVFTTVTLTGDVTGTGSGSIATTLATVNSNVGSFGSASQVATFTVDAKGRLTAAGNTTIAVSSTNVSDFTEAAQDAIGAMVDGSLVYVDGTPLLTRAALTGDITASQGSNATTLATVNGNVGSFGSSTAIPSFTVNGKGLLTAASTNAVIAPAGTLTGTTLASNVVTSSLTAVGTLATGNATAIVDAATASAQGKVELATLSEVNTGTDTSRAIVPDDLAGSYAGTKAVSVYAVEGATALTTGDGKAYFRVPPALNGMNLVGAAAAVIAKSTSGLPTVQLARGRQSSATSAHTFADMLTTKVTIDANEFDSKDAATAAVIDTANDDVATGDLIRVDVDVAGTAATGLIVTLEFRLP